MVNNKTAISRGIFEFPIDINHFQYVVRRRVLEIEDFDDRALLLNQFIAFGEGLLKESISLLERTRKQQLEKLIKTHQKERERLLETKPKKERFSTKEVLAITGIKSETTLLKYFNNGTIVAHKDSSERWYVLREDLRNYVGHDNF